ncbi:MAG: hypothetical protein ABJA49_07055 [Betaproteobacteria bacterium]
MTPNPRPKTLQWQVRVAAMTAPLSLTASTPLRTATSKTLSQTKGDPT